MRYEKGDLYRIRLVPDGTDPLLMLLAIARHSYETATPRGCGVLQPYFLDIPDESLHKYIETQAGQPKKLLMDYVNGRDCRTKVTIDRNGQWYFDAYAFTQRKVTPEEFRNGGIIDDACRFLDEVIEMIERAQAISCK